MGVKGTMKKTWCALTAATVAICLLAGPAVASSLEVPDGGSEDGTGIVDGSDRMTREQDVVGDDGSTSDNGRDGYGPDAGESDAVLPGDGDHAITPFAVGFYPPNKAWVRMGDDGAWQMVTDSERGNQAGANGQSFFNGDRVAAAVNMTIQSVDWSTEDRLELADDWGLVDRYLDPADTGEVRVYALALDSYREPSTDGINTIGEDVTDRFEVTVEGTVTRAVATVDYLEELNARTSPMQFSMLVPFVVNFDVAADLLEDRNESGTGNGDSDRNTCADGDMALANKAGVWWEDQDYWETNEPVLCIVRPELVKDVKPIDTEVEAEDTDDGGSADDTDAEAKPSINGKAVLPGQRVSYELELHVDAASDYVLERLELTDDYDPRTTPDRDSLTLTARDETVGDATENDVTTIPAEAYTADWDETGHRFTVRFHREWLDENWEPAVPHRVLLTFDAMVRTDIDWSSEPDDGDGPRIENRGWASLNNGRVTSNVVDNPVLTLDPYKDVSVEVGSESADGMSIYRGQTFLYQLNSSILAVDRAYPTVSSWHIDDDFDETGDTYTGQWAVYAVEDLHNTDGTVLAAKGMRIAGSGFDSTPFGGELFTLEMGEGMFSVSATERYLALVSTDGMHPQAWRAYVQFTRVKAGEFANTFIETLDGARRPSNTVTTVTPERSPSISIEKFDEASGPEAGDRDGTEDALALDGGDVTIVFRVTNTGDVPLTALELSDETVAGDGEVTELSYPDDWETLTLAPGESVDVRGVLRGVSATHTDRATVEASPVIECLPHDDDPFDDIPAQPAAPDEICTDTPVESEPDDWNAYVPETPVTPETPSVRLPHTGGDVVWLMMLGGAATLVGGIMLAVLHRRKASSGA
ncbi:LPXTG cell wall anchor domain-containing protein [Bifidobacterium miconisargentati]|uniref:LPXTG cell wall anchor domain-containing protein n=1 Tax=Bifidobacterium miconisargentati TaxID=2834437 RepID=UPI001BDC0BA2|nr:LPXTG cell wall anchor domain-containing protein [Bifidobacterium miconisargentati]MBW3090099.1 LPXTG cell wall anchor domain-containing protein [Bifidobacterium miconisargentati]